MSFSSGEVFAAPQRPADFTPSYGQFDPAYPLTEEVTREIWTPQGDEPGQHRMRVVTGEGNYNNRLFCGTFLSIEEVAAAGMRQVFERFDLRSFYEHQRDAETYGAPVDIHTAAITFPSSERHALLVDAFADDTRRAVRFRIAHCEDSYDGPELLTRLDANQLLMSTEGETKRHPDDDGGIYDLHLYSHDLRVHFPAWLCLPDDISARIRRRASDVISNYNAALESPSLARVDAARKVANRLGFLLDQTVNIWNMRDLVRGTNDTYDEMMSEILQWKSSGYSASTLEQINNPREDRILVARHVW